MINKISIPIYDRQAISISNFNIVLKILISNITKLDRSSCKRLISSILEYEWLKLEPGFESDRDYNLFMELYSEFLSVLVSSFPKFLNDVTSKLISEFFSFGSQHEKISNHHRILNRVIKFAPTTISSLPTVLQKHMPHHLSSDLHQMINYMSNMLLVLTYCPEIQYDVWLLIIEYCIKLDVELQNEIDELDDDEIDDVLNEESLPKEKDGNEQISTVGETTLTLQEPKSETHDEDSNDEDDDEEDDDENNSYDEGEVQYVNPVSSSDHIKMLLKKLDSLMSLLINRTSQSFTMEELNNGNGVYLFNTITSLFNSHIISTHFTKLIQFLLFQISQYQPELSDSFLVLLIDIAFNTSEILEKRLKAMQYLSSYIARAQSLSRHQIVFVVSYLIGWLNKYVIERECEVIDMDNDNKGRIRDKRQSGGMERFKLFYAAFQALLYIFCFRYNTLYKTNSAVEETSSDSEWECGIDHFFQRMIIAKFNPLKYCDETVVYIFAKIATRLNVCYCYSIIEHNKRERISQTNNDLLPSSVGNFKLKQEFLDLEAYFPFDPLVLPVCKSIIDKNYIEWSAVNPANDENEEEDSCSHPEDENTEGEEITSEEE